MYKGIFIHVPKAAGTSMLEAFEPYKDDGLITDHSSCIKRPLLPLPIHAMFNFKVSSAAVIRHVLGAYAWKGTFKFCFVRNPWDRYVSNWHWLTRTGQPSSWADRGWHGNDGEITFEDFVHQIGAAYEMPIQGYQHDKWHMRNQIEHISDPAGNIMVDFIGRLENIEKDFVYVCNQIGYPDLVLPHTNHVGFYEGKERKKEPHYSTHYTPELVEIVRERSKADIEAFDYTFEWAQSDE